jgi:GT2 family glycosyltransferase
MMLSIVIVNWNTESVLRECLRSIGRPAAPEAFEIILVDNASIDGTVDMVRREFPHATVLSNPANRGFAAACNQGIVRAQGRYLLLLNPDTVVHPGALDSMTEFMDNNSEVGICGPLLLNSDGTTQPSVRRFPGFRSALHHNTILRSVGLFRGRYRAYMMSGFAYDRTLDVDQVMGAALMTRRSVIDQIGLLDERFFMYYEEVDFCCRAKRAGWRVTFVPQARITHLGCMSSDQVPVVADAMRLTSLITYFRKYRGALVTTLFNGVFKPAVLMQHLARFAGGVLVYLPVSLLSNAKTRQKVARRIRESALLLTKYSWQLLKT